MRGIQCLTDQCPPANKLMAASDAELQRRSEEVEQAGKVLQGSKENNFFAVTVFDVVLKKETQA